MDCLFCKIAKKEIASQILYETPTLVAFRDIAPQAPVHLLIVPKKHIETINALSAEDESLIGQMVFAAKHLASESGIDDNGYRLVYNVNRQGGQAVYHIHLHLLGGRQMAWPPG